MAEMPPTTIHDAAGLPGAVPVGPSSAGGAGVPGNRAGGDPGSTLTKLPVVVVAALAAGQFLVGLDASVATVALPRIQRETRLTRAGRVRLGELR
jgi:hypothetical protein